MGVKTAKLFKNGQSQAVRLPKAFRMPGASVYIHRVGDYLVLIPRENPWRSMFEAAGALMAAHALSLGETLVTHNLNAFWRVKNLRIEDWLAE